VASFKLTVRNGPKVAREEHESLEDAVAAMRAQGERIRSEGRMPEVSLVRTYEPGDRVRARLEISAGGLLRGRDAGLDVMGDGSLIPYRGGVFRKPIEVPDGETAYDAVAAAMRG
jgi:hypothetical protein